MTHEHRDVIVDRDSGGTGLGMVLGIILAILVVLALVWYFGFGGFDGGGQQTQEQQNIEIQPPGDQAPPGGGEQPPGGGEQPGGGQPGGGGYP
jgi:hypothetical protein